MESHIDIAAGKRWQHCDGFTWVFETNSKVSMHCMHASPLAQGICLALAPFALHLLSKMVTPVQTLGPLKSLHFFHQEIVFDVQWFLRYISVDVCWCHDITRQSFTENSIFCAEVGRARKHGPRAEGVWCSGLTVIVVKWFNWLFTAKIQRNPDVSQINKDGTRSKSTHNRRASSVDDRGCIANIFGPRHLQSQDWGGNIFGGFSRLFNDFFSTLSCLSACGQEKRHNSVTVADVNVVFTRAPNQSMKVLTAML